MSDTKSDLVTTERAGLLAWELCRGVIMTTEQAAELVETTERAAAEILSKLSRVLPITYDDRKCGKFWYSTSFYFDCIQNT